MFCFFQANDYATRKASPHSQQTLSDQNVECTVLYEPHDLNASLSSGSDKGSHTGSHTGSGSGSGSSRYVTRRTNRLNNDDVAGQKYNHSRHHSKKTGLPGSPPSTSNANSVPLAQLATESKPSIYAHGDYGSPSHSSVNYGFNVPPQPNVQSGPAYTNIRPPHKNSSTGNYLAMDHHLYKDSGVPSSVSSSFRQDEASSVVLEDSGIEIGTTNPHHTGYVASRESAYSQDDYLLPVSHRIGNYGTEEQLRLQQLQLQRQEQQLLELQRQHNQIQQQLQIQHQQHAQEQQSPVQPNTFPEQIPHHEQRTIPVKSESRFYQDGSMKSSISSGKGSSAASDITESFELGILSDYGSTSSNITQTSHNIAQSLSQGKYGRKPPVKQRTSEFSGRSGLNQVSYLAAKQEKQLLSQEPNSPDTEIPNLYKSSRHEMKQKLHAGRKHTFAPQEGYTEVATSRSSVRSSRSTSSKGSSHSKTKVKSDPNRPMAANIILNIPGYRVPGSLGRNKRLSSAEESDMESMTSVSVTSREVANIMTQAMRMQRNSSRRRSKGQCEHHHRTFTTKPGRSGNLSRSSNFRGSNSSSRSKGKKACTRCGSQSQKAEKGEKSGESLISFIEQSMRSFLLNSSETVSTEDTSSETKSSSERNKTPSDESPGNTLEPDNDQSPPASNKPASNQINAAPTLFEIASYCDIHTMEIQNDYSNTLGYGIHLQQVNFNPEKYFQTQRQLSNNILSLGHASSAFDRFKGRTRLIYCVHMLDKDGVASKNGDLQEGDYLIEVRLLPVIGVLINQNAENI